MERISSRPRRDWRQKAEAVGFTFHHMDGQDYWAEDAYYAFSLAEIEDGIEAPAQALHQLCLALVDEVTASETLLSRMAIPEAHWDLIARSWRSREPSLYGRFDLAYDGQGPAKLYEYNADTPTSVFESAVFQWTWLEDLIARGDLPEGADQFNSLHEKLRDRLAVLVEQGGLMHFASDPDFPEDRQTVRYLEDLALQAGLDPRFIPIERIGLDADGQFVDEDNLLIQVLFKLYPWEDIFHDPYAASLAEARTLFLEPPWKAILSNKAILPLLWERHPGHPNLLEAYFEDDPRRSNLGRSHVVKPFFSREGANIELVDLGRREPVLDQGYGAEGRVFQALHALPRFTGGVYPVIGAWMVGDQPAGIGIREDVSKVTRNMSRFRPHAIL